MFWTGIILGVLLGGSLAVFFMGIFGNNDSRESSGKEPFNSKLRKNPLISHCERREAITFLITSVNRDSFIIHLRQTPRNDP
jgi:hypothetical protein